MQIHILTAPTLKGFNCAYPLRAFHTAIKRRGFSVRIYYRPDARVSACDVLCVTSEHWKQLRRTLTEESAFTQVMQYRDAVPVLIWFDLTDSSGTTRFELLPYVDLYAKNQLLRDRRDYTRRFYGMRPHTDFYHRHCHINDTREEWRVPARPNDLHKLAVGWNLGLGSYVCRDQNFLSRLGPLRVHWPFVAYKWGRTSSNGVGRPLDVSFRGRLDYQRETVSHQRLETHRRLVSFCRRAGYSMSADGKLPYEEYRAELRRSKIVVSPFGFGEINAGRDFECFTDGAALVKPDMSHLATWPEYFEPGVTYAPYSWDFSNFDETLSSLLTDPQKRACIAAEGQSRYLRSLSTEGATAFADHFERLVVHACHNSVEAHAAMRGAQSRTRAGQ